MYIQPDHEFIVHSKVDQITYVCVLYIMCSTGLWVPHVPDIQGIEHAQVGY